MNEADAVKRNMHQETVHIVDYGHCAVIRFMGTDFRVLDR